MDWVGGGESFLEPTDLECFSQPKSLIVVPML